MYSLINRGVIQAPFTVKREKTVICLAEEVTYIVQSEWKNWQSVWSAVRQRNEHDYQGECVQDSGNSFTGYVAETWALEKEQENKLGVAAMRMLRWICGLTKLDKIRQEIIRGTKKVGEIAKKFQERRLKW